MTQTEERRRCGDQKTRENRISCERHMIEKPGDSWRRLILAIEQYMEMLVVRLTEHMRRLVFYDLMKMTHEK